MPRPSAVVPLGLIAATLIDGISRVSSFDLDLTSSGTRAASLVAGSMPPQLPAELWARIFINVPAYHDLRTCMLLNSAIGAEAERALYTEFTFTHIVPLLRLRLALKRSEVSRRARRLRAVRSLFVRLKNIGPGYAYFPSSYGSLQFLFRKAMLRELARFVAACPGLVHLELQLPMLPGAREPLNLGVLMHTPFRLSSLNCTLPFTPDLVAFLARHAPTLRHLILLPLTAASEDELAAAAQSLPAFPHMRQLDTYTELCGLFPAVSWHRVQARSAPSFDGLHDALQRIAATPLPLSIEVFRIDAPCSHLSVMAVSATLPALKGLSIDFDSVPTDPAAFLPWDADDWTLAFEPFARLVNFRLRLTGRAVTRHRWRAEDKLAALQKWQKACPTLKHVSFPGEQGHWIRSSRTGKWTAPAL